MSFWEEIGANIADTINPLAWFQQGQARDEARTIRQEDRADQDRNQSNQLTVARESIKAGGQGSIGSTMPIGQQSDFQELSRGQNVKTSSQRQADELNLQILKAQKEGLELDNLKKSQLLNPPKTGKPTSGSNFMPGGGQSVLGGITEKNMQRTTSFPGKPHMEPGAITGSGFEVTPTGLAPIPSTDVKERIEDSPYELRHFYRYGILPNAGDNTTKPPRSALPPGADDWLWSGRAQEWRPISLKDKALQEKFSSGWGQGARSIWKNLTTPTGKGRVTPQGSYLKYYDMKGGK